MKKYLLFVTQVFYPEGGWNDFRADFDTCQEAKAYAESEKCRGNDYWHIVNTESMDINDFGITISKKELDERAEKLKQEDRAKRKKPKKPSGKQRV